MADHVNCVPEGFGTLSSYVTVKDGTAAIEFYKKAFGAEVVLCMPGPNGEGVMHAELQIGDTRMMLGEEFPGGSSSPQTLKGTSVTLHLYLPDVDAAFDKAIAAGATELMQPMDAFWGDRMGKVADPFGHHWSIATHTKDLTPEEIAKGQAEWLQNMPACS